MLQSLTGMRREYVVERNCTPDGPRGYAAYWRDPVGMASFGQRVICLAETVIELCAVIERHYPGAICMWVPEDVTALVAEAIAATAGES